MKKLLLAILIAVFGVTAVGVLPVQDAFAYGQKNDDKKKKDVPGPPVVKDKERKGDKQKDRPKKDRRPDLR